MADEEKLSLSGSSRKHVRYGSMAKENNIKREKFFKHTVQPEDTLQGLALRYGVTMEQIKRANKMWTTDSLFLRSTLDIPVLSEALNVSSIISTAQSPHISPVKQKQETNNSTSAILESTDVIDQLNVSVVGVADNDVLKKEESAADFLIRIDSHIAQSKDKALQFQKKTNNSENDLRNFKDGLGQSYQCYPNSLTGSSSLSDLTVDPSLPPQPVVMTKGRKVRSSLKKLEREQDEIFEL